MLRLQTIVNPRRILCLSSGVLVRSSAGLFQFGSSTGRVSEPVGVTSNKYDLYTFLYAGEGFDTRYPTVLSDIVIEPLKVGTITNYKIQRGNNQLGTIMTNSVSCLEQLLIPSEFCTEFSDFPIFGVSRDRNETRLLLATDGSQVTIFSGCDIKILHLQHGCLWFVVYHPDKLPSLFSYNTGTGNICEEIQEVFGIKRIDTGGFIAFNPSQNEYSPQEFEALLVTNTFCRKITKYDDQHIPWLIDADDENIMVFYKPVEEQKWIIQHEFQDNVCDYVSDQINFEPDKCYSFATRNMVFFILTYHSALSKPIRSVIVRKRKGCFSPPTVSYGDFVVQDVTETDEKIYALLWTKKHEVIVCYFHKYKISRPVYLSSLTVQSPYPEDIKFLPRVGCEGEPLIFVPTATGFDILDLHGQVIDDNVVKAYQTNNLLVYTKDFPPDCRAYVVSLK
ncbi:MAG: hypothetical protein NZT61_05800 [Deltaproteobacteria bacterium]|nr:hypothetical protein [Deltaproteobacteria bacterium]